MLDILTVVLPVFLVTGAGYLAAWRGLFAASAVDGLMVFTQKFAIPCLLFTGVATLDLGADFDPALLLILLHRVDRELRPRASWRAVPLRPPMARQRRHRLRAALRQQRAPGPSDHRTGLWPDALAPNFAIISIHAAYCYLLGITTMEIVKSGGGGGLR
jgi:malonate transporter